MRGGAAAKWDNYLFAVVPQTVITLIAVIMLLVAARQIQGHSVRTFSVRGL